jgi:hypothetical protein
MGRIRTVKPEFNSNEALSSLSCAAHLLAQALLCYADDEGYFNANPDLVRAGTCPLRKDFKKIEKLLAELQSVGYLRFGVYGGKRYGQIIHFKKHQRISHPSASAISKLLIAWEDVPQNSGGAPEDTRSSSGESAENIGKALEPLRPEQGTGNREWNREQGTGNRGADSGEATESTKALPALRPRGPFSSSITDDAQMIATAVIDETKVTTRWARDQIFEQARCELKEHPGDMDGLRDAMVLAWKEYMACAKAGKLRAPPTSPEKFYGEGKWKSSKLWGLKNGMRAYESSGQLTAVS